MSFKKLHRIFSLAAVSINCGNTLNRIKDAEWVSIPYSVDKGLTEPCSTLSFVTREKQYGLVHCVTKIGMDDNYIIVASEKNTNDSPQYWIINKSIQGLGKVERKLNVEGPLDSLQFNNRKKDLNIVNLAFTKNIN